MADQSNLVDTEDLQQTQCVHGELLQTELVGFWLRRFTEAYLVGQNHAISSCSKLVRGLLPSWATEVFAMEEHSGLAIGWAGWRNVHEGHLEPLFPLRLKLIELHGPGVDKCRAIQVERDIAVLNKVLRGGGGGGGDKTEKA